MGWRYVITRVQSVWKAATIRSYMSLTSSTPARLDDGGLSSATGFGMFFHCSSLVSAALDVANPLEILIEFGVVILAQRALQIAGIIDYGVEHAALLHGASSRRSSMGVVSVENKRW